MEAEIYLHRIHRVQEGLTERGAAAQFISAGSNFAYLFGVRPLSLERLILLSIPAQGVPRLIVPKLSEPEFSVFSSSIKLSPWADGEDPYLQVEDEIRKLPKDAPLFLDHGVSAKLVLNLVRRFPSLPLSIDEEAVSSLRIAKDADESRKMLEVGKIADLAMDVAIEACIPGVTEMDVAAAIITALLKHGAAADPPMPIVASGPNGAMPHHSTGHRKLVEGDAVVIDFGGLRNHYYSDMTRTVFLGEPDPEFLRVYEVVRTAQAKALAAIRPGVPLGELDAIARTHITQAGYGPFFTHRLGHGLGVDVHEEPYLYTGNREKLAVGMCFSVEPGVYLPGRFGVRIEDCVIVQEEGPLVLTSYTKDLVLK